MSADDLLGRATLPRLAPGVRPLVDPAELRTRVVHFGLGAFHRAHQAVYTEHAAARSGEPWGITAVAPRSAGTVHALRSQDCLYSLTERRPDGHRTRVVGSVVGALALGSDAKAVDALLTDPEVTVVTLTVTEKGYHRSPATGGLDTTAAPVAADLAAAPGGPLTTVVGRLAAGLAARMRAGAPPLAVVSCDNMADNGAALARVVHDFVRASAWPDRAEILDRMAGTVAFPATVVDRIVPATGEADRAAAVAALGVRDALAVTGEPYRQWVLEDSFTAPRPPWELDGALFVPDVAPYQLTKLRLLNGSHSALAHLGTAAGLTTIAETMATDWGERLVRALCAELSPTLPAGGPDPGAYADDLVVRFRNPAMHHLLRQIGSDASLKIGERWLPALRELRARGASTPVLELALAAWAHGTRRAQAPDASPGPHASPGSGVSAGPGALPDPAAEALAACWRPANRPVGTVRALLRVLGATDLAEDDALTAAVAERFPALDAGRVEI
ncbi:putative mannitol dehydrogenase protein [Streptomyces ambofaciens ATCC 23877]|uniref:Mannitol-1-phosphate 5-dehydrogenase n=1 Tax=Streptomyces ambofaciens (strain ATCC 23877 / 3486 / DSM 40053 / JCM 4204 / NBRC 12836 / NRRL B-2516) TaxID=278992 RepID=A0AE13_STRA7|nr:mannitol dehydrogenase family protein [Streptomyces ambofaciens]AKZ59603.1 putative mannitol dehydrogenase protein [Streptomyces ambofaciens ATCC 23877]CAJ88721.1 putative mannitol dehydrogenase protein [Streptomyces ambofaciens ATCC 23877]